MKRISLALMKRADLESDWHSRLFDNPGKQVQSARGHGRWAGAMLDAPDDGIIPAAPKRALPTQGSGKS
jgi:hypothetical protein